MSSNYYPIQRLRIDRNLLLNYDKFQCNKLQIITVTMSFFHDILKLVMTIFIKSILDISTITLFIFASILYLSIFEGT